jgi:hypothetical protein
MITWLGKTSFRNEQRKFGILKDDLRRHIYMAGKTGSGKSVLLENLAIQHIQNGDGVCFLDPHGDSAETLLKYIPSHRINDVIYFNPCDTEFPIAFNPMENPSPELRHLACSGLVGVFQKIWHDSWGPRLEYILRNTILTLLETPGSTLLGIQRLLSDDAYRARICPTIKDSVVKAFWYQEYEKMPPKLKLEAISPIQNKVGQFLTAPLIRNIVGQSKSSFDVRDVMDNQKIMIVNLAKGKVGEDNGALLGSMLITKFYLSAMSRADMPENKRKDFYLYADEFQNFATESFANILSEARKYRLSLILANQYLDQLIPTVRHAILGNCGTIISFRTGASDGKILENELAPFKQEDFVNLPKYNVYLKLMIDGLAGDAFSASTLPPCPLIQGHQNKLKRVSRERYARNKKDVEARIKKCTCG